MRVGLGYDVHPLVEGRDLILGGVKIPYKKGLKGHSDSDVILHAVCDALLGAAAQGDIGQQFPDTDQQFKGISSLELLKRTNQIIAEAGFKINNIDITLVLEEPRIGPFREQMQANIAGALSIDPDQVGVKATTSEGMGFVGLGQGAAAYCICSIE